MKSCATGLIVRFFNITVPICTGRIGKSTGRTFFSRHSLALQAKADPRQGYPRNHLPGPARRLVR
jgi:hypothetical protein